MIKVIECGSQSTQNIGRRIREKKVYSDIVPFSVPLDKIKQEGLEGIVISGGQFSVYDSNSPHPPREVFEIGVPVLGICYGQQLIAEMLGGKVEATGNREYGKTRIRIVKESPLFNGIPQEFNAWMSHADNVTEVPKGFEVVAESKNGIAAIQNLERKIFAVQFHPELDNTQHGREILENYLKICNAQRTWHPENFVDSTIRKIRERVGDGIAIAGVSGGVDSTTLAVLMNKALGDKFYAVFVNNGLLRQDEESEVCGNLSRLGINFIYVNAVDRFLTKLKGVVDPEEKRKIIGHEFIRVFEEPARRLGAKFLGQGTLYPDVIESVPAYGQSSATIKTHHNVGGLPPDMHLELIEPFRYMFKDELRVQAYALGMPKDIVERQPFPGPGLAVRIVGDVTPEKLKILRHADQIFTEEQKARGIYYDISQGFAILTDTQAVGVMGDGRTYQYMIILRAVVTKDFISAAPYKFKEEDLDEICTRVINEVKGVNRVVYDRSQKPPSTIEIQ